MPKVFGHILARVGHIGDVEDSKPSLPVGTIHIRPPVSWVVGVLSRPGLNRHVVDVDPTPARGLPRDLRLADLDDSRKVAEPGEVEVRDGDATTGITLADVTRLVVRVGNEDVPLVIDHVGVQVVRPARVVGIIPEVNEARIAFVSHID